MKLKRTRNKLLKNGFIPTTQDGRYEQWTDIQRTGTDISFYHDGESLSGPLKVHGRTPDNLQIDEFNSMFSVAVKTAIQLSRAGEYLSGEY